MLPERGLEPYHRSLPAGARNKEAATPKRETGPRLSQGPDRFPALLLVALLPCVLYRSSRTKLWSSPLGRLPASASIIRHFRSRSLRRILRIPEFRSV